MGDGESSYVNARIERQNLDYFYNAFALTAGFQGRIAYLLMSIHAVNPDLLPQLCRCDPTEFLFANMLYGMGVMIYSRPFMTPLGGFPRLTFSFLGSMMFNYSSMLFWDWLVDHISQRPNLLTFFGFLSGRIMMVHFLAFLYHVDSRSRYGRGRNLSSDFEAMYNR